MHFTTVQQVLRAFCCSQNKYRRLAAIFPNVSITWEYDSTPHRHKETILKTEQILAGNFTRDQHYIIYHVPKLLTLIEKYKSEIRREFTFHPR